MCCVHAADWGTHPLCCVSNTENCSYNDTYVTASHLLASKEVTGIGPSQHLTAVARLDMIGPKAPRRVQ